MQHREFTFRLGTQDFAVFCDVMVHNEYHLPERFADGDTVIDVGAHIGSFSFACLQRGAARVLCVEPDRENHRLLRQNLAQFGSSVCAWNAAVWAAGVERVQLQRMGDMTAMHTCVLDRGDGVRACSLDWLVQTAGTPVRLLKLDCEGAEWPALFTAQDLSGVQEIALEAHWKLTSPAWEWPCTPDGLTALMGKHGFTLRAVKNDKNECVTTFLATRPDAMRRAA